MPLKALREILKKTRPSTKSIEMFNVKLFEKCKYNSLKSHNFNRIQLNANNG